MESQLVTDHFDRCCSYENELHKWWASRAGGKTASRQGFELLAALLAYDPEKRITAHESLRHPWWTEEPKAIKG